MTKENKTFVPPTHQEIAAYAYQLWIADGRRHGRDLDHWIQAEAHLTADRQYEAGMLPDTAKAAISARKADSAPVPKPTAKTERRKKVEIRPGIAKQSAFV